MFSHTESHSKISNLMITELFYSYICNIDRSCIYSRSNRHIHLSAFRYSIIKNGYAGPKRFRGFRETGSGSNSGWGHWVVSLGEKFCENNELPEHISPFVLRLLSFIFSFKILFESSLLNQNKQFFFQPVSQKKTKT